MGEPLRVGALLRLVKWFRERNAPEAHGLCEEVGRRSWGGGESSKHSLKDKLEEAEPGRPSLPNLKLETCSSGCSRLGTHPVE